MGTAIAVSRGSKAVRTMCLWHAAAERATMAGTSDYGTDAISAWLVDRIASEMNIEPETISLDETFSNLGLDSLKTLVITAKLGEFLGAEELNPALLWDYPTIQKLAEHLTGLVQGTAGF
jgi:acyl carrier protein